MTHAELLYCIEYAENDYGEYNSWTTDIDGTEEAAYLKAKKLHVPFLTYLECEYILEKAFKEIEKYEIAKRLEYGDDLVMDLLGKTPVDPDEINALVAARDEHTLKFFWLKGLSDEKLDAWDANELEELPDICDFYEDFEPESPFDFYWVLHIEFAEKPEKVPIKESEVEETLNFLFFQEDFDYEEITSYLARSEKDIHRSEPKSPNPEENEDFFHPKFTY